MHVRLNAEGAEAKLYGLNVLSGKQHHDNHVHVDHAEPHGTSQQYFKGVLGGNAHLVFTGRIHVHPDAQKTNAYQLNRHLLLSPQAAVDSRPQLEIFADDVRCTHGAAIGQLDDEMLFYMKSRGLPESLARHMLTHGFASDLLENLSNEALRSALESLLSEALRRVEAR
jgi:Fe-S cluster assembly protein SufD